MAKLYEVNCAGMTLSVYDDCVSLTPKGTLGFLTKGTAGERKIFYKDITSIQFKPSTKLLSGFIEFYFAGHNTKKQSQGVFYGADNDNRFTFYNKFLPEMLQINDYIQGQINNFSHAILPTNEANSTDELRKYKQLLDDGIITQEDFDAKKKQLLGL